MSETELKILARNSGDLGHYKDDVQPLTMLDVKINSWPDMNLRMLDVYVRAENTHWIRTVVDYNDIVDNRNNFLTYAEVCAIFATRYADLRQKALDMQVAVGHVLARGGADTDRWWEDLVAAQQRLARQTNMSGEEHNRYDMVRKYFGD